MSCRSATFHMPQHRLARRAHARNAKPQEELHIRRPAECAALLAFPYGMSQRNAGISAAWLRQIRSRKKYCTTPRKPAYRRPRGLTAFQRLSRLTQITIQKTEEAGNEIDLLVQTHHFAPDLLKTHCTIKFKMKSFFKKMFSGAPTAAQDTRMLWRVLYSKTASKTAHKTQSRMQSIWCAPVWDVEAQCCNHCS